MCSSYHLDFWGATTFGSCNLGWPNGHTMTFTTDRGGVHVNLKQLGKIRQIFIRRNRTRKLATPMFESKCVATPRLQLPIPFYLCGQSFKAQTTSAVLYCSNRLGPRSEYSR
jgi:hypothetical protein